MGRYLFLQSCQSEDPAVVVQAADPAVVVEVEPGVPLIPTEGEYLLGGEACGEGDSLLSLMEDGLEVKLSRLGDHTYELQVDRAQVEFSFSNGQLTSVGRVSGNFEEGMDLKVYLLLNTLTKIEAVTTPELWTAKLITRTAVECSYEFSTLPYNQNDRDNDGVPNEQDCAPDDELSWVETTWYLDNDGDSFGGDQIRTCGDGEAP